MRWIIFPPGMSVLQTRTSQKYRLLPRRKPLKTPVKPIRNERLKKNHSCLLGSSGMYWRSILLHSLFQQLPAVTESPSNHAMTRFYETLSALLPFDGDFWTTGCSRGFLGGVCGPALEPQMIPLGFGYDFTLKHALSEVLKSNAAVSHFVGVKRRLILDSKIAYTWVLTLEFLKDWKAFFLSFSFWVTHPLKNKHVT